LLLTKVGRNAKKHPYKYLVRLASHLRIQRQSDLVLEEATNELRPETQARLMTVAYEEEEDDSQLVGVRIILDVDALGLVCELVLSFVEG